MKLNIKNRYKKLLTFMGIMFAFFIGVGNFNATFECHYSDDSGNNIIKVTIDDAYQMTPIGSNNHQYWTARAEYDRWNGAERGKTKEVYAFLSGKYDLWMMKNKKCPPYITGFYEIKRLWPDSYCQPCFSLTKNASCYCDGYNVDSGTEKTLELSTTAGAGAYNDKPNDSNNPIANARASRTLYGSGSQTGASFFATPGTQVSDSKWIETLGNYNYYEMENGADAVIYVRGTPIAESSPEYDGEYLGYYDIEFYEGYNSCVSSNPAAVEITQQPRVKKVGAYSPYFYIKVKAKQVTTDDNPVVINCTAKTPNGELIISPLANGTEYYYADTLAIGVTPSSSAPASYEQKDIQCEYMLNSKDNSTSFNVSRVKLSANGYNDGTVKDDKITSKFEYMSQNGKSYLNKTSSATVIGKDTKIDYYEFYNNNNTGTRTIRFRFKPEEFSTKLLANSGTCPNLYVERTPVNYFDVFFTSDNDNRVKADLVKKTWTTSSGQIKSETYGNTTTSTVSVPVQFYKTLKTQGETPYYNGAITFYVENNELYYYIQLAQEGKSIEKVVPETKITSLNQELIVSTGKYGGEFGITYYYHVKVYSDYLTKIESYLKTINSQTQKPGNHTATIREPGSAMAGAREIFAISANEINDPNKVNESAQEGDGIEGTVGDDGTDDFITAAGKTDELQISDSSNDGDLVCEDLFGPEDNRNSFWDVLHTVRIGIQIATPILLVLLTMVDFTKATALEDALPKAKKNAITRSIIAVVIFLVPTLINLLFNLIGMTSCPI